MKYIKKIFDSVKINPSKEFNFDLEDIKNIFQYLEDDGISCPLYYVYTSEDGKKISPSSMCSVDNPRLIDPFSEGNRRHECFCPSIVGIVSLKINILDFEKNSEIFGSLQIVKNKLEEKYKVTFIQNDIIKHDFAIIVRNWTIR